MSRLFDAFQLLAMAGLTCLGLGRALILYARGIRVVVVDRRRSPGRVLEDLLSATCLLLWAYETVAYSWPLRLHLPPQALASVLVDAPVVKGLGAVSMASGLVIYGLAMHALAGSWRIGIDRDTPGPLVTHGIFSRTRNPIYLGVDLLVLGTFLMQGRLIFLLFALAVAGILHRQIRREERFLTRTFGDRYRSYRARVGRYLTWP